MPACATAEPDLRALVVAPEPVDWLRPLLAALGGVATIELFAPWVLPPLPARVRAVGFAARRDGAELPRPVISWPLRASFNALEFALRGHARGKAARTFFNRFITRRVVDRLAAHHVRRAGSSVVLAPSLCARHTFAAAKCEGARCLLLEDLPDLDGLVDGLDALAQRHPDASFLLNHRPRFADHVDQRAERIQADAIAVRGRAAWQRLAAHDRVLLPRAPVVDDPPSRGNVVLLAGPAVARSGTMHLRSLLDASPSLTVRVQPAEVIEPAWLRAHRRVQLDPHASLQDVGAVLSLGALESHPRAVDRAIAAAVPIVGTPCSTGVATGVQHVEPHDFEGILGALERALAGDAPNPAPWSDAPSLRTWIAQ